MLTVNQGLDQRVIRQVLPVDHVFHQPLLVQDFDEFL